MVASCASFECLLLLTNESILPPHHLEFTDGIFKDQHQRASESIDFLAHLYMKVATHKMANTVAAKRRSFI